MQQALKPSVTAFGSKRPSRLAVRCAVTAHSEDTIAVNRRNLLNGAVLSSVALLSPLESLAAGKGSQANVGSYLPKAEQGFVAFKPSDSQTPVRDFPF